MALDGALIAVDVWAFEHAIAGGTPETLSSAAELYQGDLLAGLAVDEAPFEDWLQTERARLRELAFQGLLKLLAHQNRVGATEDAISTALRLVALEPLQEPAHRELMRLYAQSGRRGAALRQYQQCVALLQRELAVEPEPETQQLYQSILRQRTATMVVPEPIVDAGSFSAPAAETLLVGRERELAQLLEALAEARAGRGRVVMVAGESGIGKTRLVAEFVAEAVQRGSRVLTGRSYESEQILPMGPWVDALRKGGILQGNEILTLSAATRAELGRLFPEIGGAADTADADMLRLFHALTSVVAHAASRGPLVVVLEDLHLADEMSLRFLAFIGRRLGGHQVLLLGTAREEDVPSARAVLRTILDELLGERRLMQLSLAPLARAETEQLIRSLAVTRFEESPLGRVVAQVWAMSQGNPFVVVEAMRTLSAPGSNAITGLPEAVRGMIAGRLDRLSPPTRELALLAAVIGREFEFRLLHQASGLAEDQVAQGIEELVRRRILHEVDGGFDFTHDRIRQVAYGALLAARRALLHGAVARALEALYADSSELPCGALGLHYRANGAWDKATSYLRRAATQAARRSASRQVVAYLEETLEASGHLPPTEGGRADAIDLRLGLWFALRRLIEYERGLAHLREAERLVTESPDPRRVAYVRLASSEYHWLTGNPTPAADAARQALATAEALDDPRLRTAAMFRIGCAASIGGDHREAEASFRACISDVSRDGRPGGMSLMARENLVWSLADLGNFDEALERGRAAVDLAERLDRRMNLVHALWVLAYAYRIKGDAADATPLAERALELAREWEVKTTLLHSAWLTGATYADAGRFSDAFPLLRQGLEDGDRCDYGGFFAFGLVNLAEAYRRNSRLEDAERCAGRALVLAQERGQRGYVAYAAHALAEIASAAQPPDVGRAEEHYRRAHELAQELGMRPLVARCHLGLAALYRTAGRRRQARAEVTTAIDMFRSMGMTSWASHADRVQASLRRG